MQSFLFVQRPEILGLLCGGLNRTILSIFYLNNGSVHLHLDFTKLADWSFTHIALHVSDQLLFVSIVCNICIFVQVQIVKSKWTNLQLQKTGKKNSNYPSWEATVRGGSHHLLRCCSYLAADLVFYAVEWLQFGFSRS